MPIFLLALGILCACASLNTTRHRRGSEREQRPVLSRFRRLARREGCGTTISTASMAGLHSSASDVQCRKSCFQQLPATQSFLFGGSQGLEARNSNRTARCAISRRSASRAASFSDRFRTYLASDSVCFCFCSATEVTAALVRRAACAHAQTPCAAAGY